jgi:hypothetical protein
MRYRVRYCYDDPSVVAHISEVFTMTVNANDVAHAIAKSRARAMAELAPAYEEPSVAALTFELVSIKRC